MNDDAELYLQWLRTRDEAAFAALARRHADLVADVAWRVGRDPGRAEDALQEALLALARDGTDRPAVVGVRAWLARAAISRARNRWASDRARSRRERVVAREEGGMAERPSGEDVRLVEALSRVDGEDAALLTLRYVHGVEYAEIAAIFDVAEATARVRVHRARERVRKAVGREELGEGAVGAAVAALPRFVPDPALVTQAIRAAVAGPRSAATGPGAAATVAAGARATPTWLVSALVVGGIAAGIWFARPWREGRRPGAAPSPVARSPLDPSSRGGLAANPGGVAAPHATDIRDKSGHGTEAEAVSTKGPGSTGPQGPIPSREARAPAAKAPVTLKMELVSAAGVVEELEISEIQVRGARWPGSVLRDGRGFEVEAKQWITIRTEDARALVPGLELWIPDPVPPVLVGRVPARDDPRLASLTLEIVDATTGRPVPGATVVEEDEGGPSRTAGVDGRLTITHDPADPRSPRVPLVDWWFGRSWTVQSPGYRFDPRNLRMWSARRKEVRVAPRESEMRTWMDGGALQVRLEPLGKEWTEKEVRLLDASDRPVTGVLVLASQPWPSALGGAVTDSDVCLGGPLHPDTQGRIAFPVHPELTVIGLDVFRGGMPIAAFLLHVSAWPEVGPREVRLPALAEVEIMLEGAPSGAELSYFASRLGAARTPQDGPAFPVTADLAALRRLEDGRLLSMAGHVEVHGSLGATERTIRFPMPVGTRKDLCVWTSSGSRWVVVEATTPGPLHFVLRWEELPAESPASGR